MYCQNEKVDINNKTIIKHGVEEHMEKFEKHLDRKQAGFYLLLLQPRISISHLFFFYNNTFYTGVYKNIVLKDMLRQNPQLRL